MKETCFKLLGLVLGSLSWLKWTACSARAWICRDVSRPVT